MHVFGRDGAYRCFCGALSGHGLAILPMRVMGWQDRMMAPIGVSGARPVLSKTTVQAACTDRTGCFVELEEQITRRGF
jgi:hypothetical protein